MDSFNFIRELKSTDSCLHAKVLGWLLDTSESHNLKHEFLENFMLLINQKTDKNLNYKVEVNHNTTYSNKIDILIESDNSISAIKCDGNCFDIEEYKRYFDEILKSKKDVNYIFLCIGNYSCDLDYVKYIRYEELPEILPKSLEKKYQDFINDYIKTIHNKVLNVLNEFRRIEELKQWQNLDKYGMLVRQIIKHFDLPVGYKTIGQSLRTYSIECHDDIFLLFICEDNSLKLQIRALKRGEKYQQLIDKSKNMNLFVADRGRVAILDEIEVLKSSDKIEEKSLNELIKIIEDSNILNHYKEFVNCYA